MNKTLKTAIKTSIAFFIIGATITLASYPVASLLEPLLDALPGGTPAEGAPKWAQAVAEHAKGSATIAGAAWTGSFFAMFGALSHMVPQAVGKVLGLNEPEGPAKIQVEPGKGVALKLEQQLEEGVDAGHNFPPLDPDSQSVLTTKIMANQVSELENHR